MSWDMWATGIPSEGSPLCPGTCGTAQKGLVYNGFPFLYTDVCIIVYSLVDELI